MNVNSKLMLLVSASAARPWVTGTIPGYTATSSTAAATLADIYDPTIFEQAVQESAIERNAFLQSGVMVADPVVNRIADGPGHVADLPFFKPLTNDEPDYVSDNPATTSTPAAVTLGKQVCAKVHAHKSWSAMDLARELGAADPLQAITNRIGHYWAVNTTKRLIASARGILADNDANDSDDMIKNISIATGNTATAANRISASAIIDAAATMGDHSSDLVALAMHSVCYHNLQKLQLISTVRDADNNIEFQTVLGKYRVIVDDSIAAVAAATNGHIYTTILFAAGAFAYGQGTPNTPSELERKADAGNGGGQDIIHSRRTEIIHPYGFAYSDSGVAAVSATYAELAAAARWDRVFANRKNVGLAFLRSNG